ncbi:recombinase family protein [Desulfobacca acetoxidans]|uniref:recombinase family protein n=1 Tax=Desulfobacca acetoxidans TaxID=60893 RepID=UPI0003152DA5|nr:recombinase family protein [Desulfobacca acetoxidans]
MAGHPKVIGYLRVSAQDQDLEKNKAAILSFANNRKLGPVEWLEEKVSGVKLGRPKGPGQSKPDQFQPEIEALLKNGSRLKFIAMRYNVSNATLINWLKKNNIDKAPDRSRCAAENSMIGGERHRQS